MAMGGIQVQLAVCLHGVWLRHVMFQTTPIAPMHSYKIAAPKMAAGVCCLNKKKCSNAQVHSHKSPSGRYACIPA
jgi:hypothetical protein